MAGYPTSISSGSRASRRRYTAEGRHSKHEQVARTDVERECSQTGPLGFWPLLHEFSVTTGCCYSRTLVSDREVSLGEVQYAGHKTCPRSVALRD